MVLPESSEQIFKYYPEATTIEFVNVDTSGVENMESMFEGCEKLTTIVGLNQFDTKKVYNMEKFFKNCSALVEVDLSSFDTSSISSCWYMTGFFQWNTALKKITFGDKFSFRGVDGVVFPEDCSYLFFRLNQLREIDFSNLVACIVQMHQLLQL